jgi:hypothetical protein
VNFDFSVFKRYRVKKLTDAREAQLRFEAFNLFNHPQFGAAERKCNKSAGWHDHDAVEVYAADPVRHKTRVLNKAAVQQG